MKIYRYMSVIIMATILGVSSATFTACSNDDDEFGTEQYSGGVSLNSFGPSPVVRGGELRFLGSGLDKITSIDIPGCSPITDIKVISPNEIRCTVPQDAQPGNVTLNFANGKITTKTLLTYSEPISITCLNPGTVRGGDVLTISGEYLNLVKEVIFAENITVAAEEFISQSRTEIKVTVPVDARTGSVVVSDGDEDMPNWIYSDTELTVVLPSVPTVLDLSAAKPGDAVTLSGNDLDLVTAILMPNGDSVDFKYTDGKVAFTLPENISDGDIMAVAPSGVKVVVATVCVVVPVVSETTPTVGVRPGDIITLKGENLNQVATITFTGVESPVKPVSTSATALRIVFPAAAQSGMFSLNLKSGKTIDVTEIVTAKPQVTGFNPNPVAAAANFTMTGSNLNLIQTVTFAPGITVNVSTSYPNKVELTAPATAESGPLTLTMANGETVETDELNIDAPVCAFITEVLTEELKGGEVMIARVVNGDVLSAVKVNGVDVQYIITDETLYISLPPTAGRNSVVTLISSNGEISYTYDIKPAYVIENILWEGEWNCSGWNGFDKLAWGQHNWSQYLPGQIMRLYYTSTTAPGEWWCISVRHGQDWGFFPDKAYGQIDMPEGGVVDIVLTRDIIDDLVTNNGLVITGTGYILNKITME